VINYSNSRAGHRGVPHGRPSCSGGAYSFVYHDDDLDTFYDISEDIYEEETGGAATYSIGPDTLVHTGLVRDVRGGTPRTAGSLAGSIDDDDNIMFRDSDHDGHYDFTTDRYEPLLYTWNSDIEPGGLLTPSVLVLPRHGGDWPSLAAMDAWRLESDFNANNGHDYYYIDDSDNDRYDDGEAIIDQYGGQDIFTLERKGDIILHNGLANMQQLQISRTSLSMDQWKFMVPGVSDLGSPLRVRITLTIEPDTPTGRYTITSYLRPVNV